MDIGDWLQGLGLGQYEALFRENDVEADVLPDLTEVDLEKLGLSLGPRKRILKAIARTRRDEAVREADGASARPASRPTPPSAGNSP